MGKPKGAKNLQPDTRPLKRIGKVHGDLTVISICEGNKHAMCLCALCNKEVKINICNLRNKGGQRRCADCFYKIRGQKQRQETASKLKGQVFGFLTVLSDEVGTDRKVICHCSGCGRNDFSVLHTNLLKKGPDSTRSCGCKTQELFSGTMQKTFGEGISHPSKLPDIAERSAAGQKRRWGYENRYDSLEFQKHFEELKRMYHGGCHPGWSPESVKKLQATMRETYGADWYFASDAFDALKREHNIGSSSNELEILAFVQSLNLIAYKKQIKYPVVNPQTLQTHARKLELDVFVPERNIAIEHNGIYWHSELFVPNYYHNQKSKIAKNLQNIQVIHVFEHEWDKRERQVKNRLRSILGANQNTIYARKCIIQPVSSQEAMDFINKYHIQPQNTKALLSVGLYYEGVLHAVATFTRHHRQNQPSIVLSRFCTIEDTTIVGGLGKISKFASEYFKEDIISWCDKRFSNGGGYTASGWVADGVIKPDYCYTNFRKVFSKQSRSKKHVNTPDGLTEHQHALNDGLFRIYDCGKIRFRYKYQP